MIDEVLKWAGATEAKKMVDVGCGIGGSSRHISRKFGCTAQGVTLSPYQANRGNELAKEQGLVDQCSFLVADALDMPFADKSFDLVWSLESGEHMPDKQQFINELFRVAQPGGRIIIVTWTHRDLEEGETSLTRKEQKLLAAINRAYYLPRWCSGKDYIDLLTAKGATDVKREDWSYIIAVRCFVVVAEIRGEEVIVKSSHSLSLPLSLFPSPCNSHSGRQSSNRPST